MVVNENEFSIHRGDLLNISSVLGSLENNISIPWDHHLVLAYINGSNYWFEVGVLQANISNDVVDLIAIRYMELVIKGNDTSSVIII